MRVTFAVLPAFASVAWAGVCRPSSHSSSLSLGASVTTSIELQPTSTLHSDKTTTTLLSESLTSTFGATETTTLSAATTTVSTETNTAPTDPATSSLESATATTTGTTTGLTSGSTETVTLSAETNTASSVATTTASESASATTTETASSVTESATETTTLSDITASTSDSTTSEITTSATDSTTTETTTVSATATSSSESTTSETSTTAFSSTTGMATTTDTTTTLSISETAATTTTSIEDPLPTNFCLKVITPGKANTGAHLFGGGPNANIQWAPDSQSRNYNLFTLDTDTGALYLSSPDAGAQVHIRSGATSSTLRANVRYSPTPLAADLSPLLCRSPSGLYTRGSLIKCAADIGGQVFSEFVAISTNTQWSLLIRTEGSVESYPGYNFDCGIFYGVDCQAPPEIIEV